MQLWWVYRCVFGVLVSSANCVSFCTPLSTEITHFTFKKLFCSPLWLYCALNQERVCNCPFTWLPDVRNWSYSVILATFQLVICVLCKVYRNSRIPLHTQNRLWIWVGVGLNWVPAVKLSRVRSMFLSSIVVSETCLTWQKHGDRVDQRRLNLWISLMLYCYVLTLLKW